MRGFLQCETLGVDRPFYGFVRSIEHALSWPTEHYAKMGLDVLTRGEGIRVSHQGQFAYVSDVRVEQRSEEAFVISCEVPFLDVNDVTLKKLDWDEARQRVNRSSPETKEK